MATRARSKSKSKGSRKSARKTKSKASKVKQRKLSGRKPKSAVARPKLGRHAKPEGKARARLTAEAEPRPRVLPRRLAAPAAAPAPAPGPLDPITQIAATSKIARYVWPPNRGVAPRGYIEGMALTYARVYCKFKVGNAAAADMAQPDTNNPARDALSWYAPQFANAGMNNTVAGAGTLRHVFVLLVGLGMQESSGRYCCGRDATANNTKADTAEAGLFQTSYNASIASPLLQPLFQTYSAHPSGFLDVFKQGVIAKPGDLTNYGTGPGRDFQALEKNCPAFAAEFTAVALRHIRTHWGTINSHAAEVKPDCDAMLLAVQNAVDASPALCAALQA
jgi:hypothetical protein